MICFIIIGQLICLLKIIDQKTATNVDLRDIKICKKVGGTLEDIETINGLCFTNHMASHSAGGPTRIENPKIALL